MIGKHVFNMLWYYRAAVRVDEKGKGVCAIHQFNKFFEVWRFDLLLVDEEYFFVDLFHPQPTPIGMSLENFLFSYCIGIGAL